jgi:hypothetical protein
VARGRLTNQPGASESARANPGALALMSRHFQVPAHNVNVAVIR